MPTSRKPPAPPGKGGERGIFAHLAWLVGTGFGTGLSPIAPGTVGSLAALFIYYLLPISGDSLYLYALVAVGAAVGIWATDGLSTDDDPDPGKAVWDEFVGMWATCLLLPKEWPWLVAAFFCFRALDVLKPWPARRLEGLHGGMGIMADDLVVGLYGAVILNLVRLGLSLAG